jgi:hypothetical protein
VRGTELLTHNCPEDAGWIHNSTNRAVRHISDDKFGKRGPIYSIG